MSDEAHFGAEVAKRMKEIRLQRGTPAAEVAEMCGCHENTVFSTERHASEPSFQYIIGFSRGMGISLNELAYGLSTPRISSII